MDEQGTSPKGKAKSTEEEGVEHSKETGEAIKGEAGGEKTQQLGVGEDKKGPDSKKQRLNSTLNGSRGTTVGNEHRRNQNGGATRKGESSPLRQAAVGKGEKVSRGCLDWEGLRKGVEVQFLIIR